MSYSVAFQATVPNLLRTRFTAALSSAFSGRVYWQKPPQQPVLPYCVIQMQTDGKRDDYVNANGWNGFVTFKVMDDDQDDTDTKLATLPALLQGLTALTVVPAKPLTLPPEEYPDYLLFTSAFVADVTLN